jgi:hypothetical protein
MVNGASCPASYPSHRYSDANVLTPRRGLLITALPGARLRFRHEQPILAMSAPLTAAEGWYLRVET